ncbi:MAG: ATP-binding cassette domain-containing protein, partial [Pseudomonadota bacterium]
MAPPLLTLDDIALTFGGTPLFTGASLSVAPRDRIALVGRNGSGKSTLLKIAAGTVEADGGGRYLDPGATVAYLPQEPDFSGFETALDYAAADLAPTDDPSAPERFLDALGLDGMKDPMRLSGGEARRAALARILAPAPDIILLDEPTNHLDLPAIEWLESAIAGARAAVVVISHDRSSGAGDSAFQPFNR